MNTLSDNERNILVDNEILNKISKFLYSNYYLLTIVILACIFWLTSSLIAGLVTFVLIASFVLVIQRDVWPAVILILFGVLMVSNGKMPENVLLYFLSLIPLVPSIIFHILYYRCSIFHLGVLFYPLIAVTIVCLLGGIGSTLPQNIKGSIVSALTIGLIPLIAYIVLRNYTSMPNNTDITIYIAKMLLFLGVAVCVEILLYYATNYHIIKDDPYRVLDLGWAISNTVATVLLMTFPLGFYLFVKYGGLKGYIYLFIGLLEYAGIFATTSRGALLVGSCVLFLSLFLMMFILKNNERKRYLFLLLGMVLIVSVLGIVFLQRIKEIINFIFVDGFNDSGRLGLYREAIRCFKEAPIFGAGFGYIGDWKQVIDQKGMYLFHNTLLQILASLGLVGVAGYVYYYFVRVKILFEKWEVFNWFVILSYFGLEGYSMLNVGSVQGIPFGIIVVMLVLGIEFNSKIIDKSKTISIKIVNKIGGQHGRIDC